jgi:regulatory protein
MRQKPEVSLRARALQYLARREYSHLELQAKLQPYVQESDDLGALLEDLTQRTWLSDKRAAAQVVLSRRSRFGTQRICHELRQKGIAEELISEALPALKDSELDAAREVWKKKFVSLPQDAQEKAKQARFLQSRGFGFEVISKILRCNSEFE